MNSKEVSQMLEIFKVHTGGAAKLWGSILNQAMQILLMTVIGRDWQWYASKSAQGHRRIFRRLKKGDN